MFTGIVEELGKVRTLMHGGNSSFIVIEAKKVLSDVHIGDSIAVNGVCLTVTEHDDSSFRADVMNETLSRSSLGSLRSGDCVNLERALSAEGRFGGHIVSGHIDGTGVITDIKRDGIAVWYTISAGPNIMRYIAEKGSIAVDGVSLTVAKVTDSTFSISMIPHTAEVTALGSKKAGDAVNLENDIIAKYVERLMTPKNDERTGVSIDMLMKNGFI